MSECFEADSNNLLEVDFLMVIELLNQFKLQLNQHKSCRTKKNEDICVIVPCS